MTILDMRNAVLARLDAALPASVQVAAHRGSAPRVGKDGFRLPAVRVYVGGVRESASSGSEPYALWQFGAIVYANDKAGTLPGEGPGSRDDAAMILVESVLSTVVGNDWSGTATKRPENVRSARVPSDEYDSQGISVWAVTWDQRLSIRGVNIATLSDFLRLRTNIDLVDDAGVTVSRPATGTITCNRALAVNGSVVPVAGVTLTARTSPTLATDFALGGTDADLAQNLMACINAQASLRSTVVATRSGSIVTISAVTNGSAGNAITLGVMGVGFTRSAATLAGGINFPAQAQVNLEGYP